jgi:hypothetical protein
MIGIDRVSHAAQGSELQASSASGRASQFALSLAFAVVLSALGWTEASAQVGTDFNAPLAALSASKLIDQQSQQSSGASLGLNVFAITATINGPNSAEAAVLVRAGDRLIRYQAGCAATAAGSSGEPVVCQSQNQSESQSQTVPQVFDLNGFEAALADANRQFARRIGPLSSINTAAAWQVDDELFVSYDYTTSQAAAASVHYHCHVHGPGGAIDCHRARQPGPNRP